MSETLRQKRAKPQLDLTYSFICHGCRTIKEAPLDLKCIECGQPMESLSRIYLEAKHGRTQRVSKKKTPARGDAQPGPQGDINAAYFLTDCRRA